MRVFLTGADGYIGAIMGPKLIEAGHDVVGLDTGFYRRGWLFDDGRPHPAVFSRDQRQITVDDLRGFDAVVHLAELSNDPIGENDPELTMSINHKGSVGLGRMAREAGVARFIQAPRRTAITSARPSWPMGRPPSVTVKGWPAASTSRAKSATLAPAATVPAVAVPSSGRMMARAVRMRARGASRVKAAT